MPTYVPYVHPAAQADVAGICWRPKALFPEVELAVAVHEAQRSGKGQRHRRGAIREDP